MQADSGSPAADFDSPWKEALEHFFEPFLALLFPAVWQGVDWSREHAFLDKELEQVAPETELGRRVVDKLVKVYRADGSEAWVLVHVEVQAQEEAAFAERMYVYNYRLYDRYRRQVASLAVLADERPSWRPDRFGYGLWGTEVSFRYAVAKLTDWRERRSELLARANPFAVLLLAHLAAQETRQDVAARGESKRALLRGLYERGLGREQARELLKLVDWLLRLPPAEDAMLWRDLREEEERRQVAYVTSWERIGYERGREEGRQEGRQEGVREGLLAGIELGLELRFGAAGLRLLPEISRLTDVAVLRAVRAGLRVVRDPDELRRIYQAEPQAAPPAGLPSEPRPGPDA